MIRSTGKPASKSAQRKIHALIVLSLLALGGCTDYWWHRSQPPSVTTLLSRAEEKLDASIGSAPSSRQDTVVLAKVIRAGLTDSYKLLKRGTAAIPPQQLDAVETALINLDGKIAVTSRAPYAELCGQFRSIRSSAAAGAKVDAAPFGLFAARTISFLASDLTLPPPVEPASAGSAPATQAGVEAEKVAG